MVGNLYIILLIIYLVGGLPHSCSYYSCCPHLLHLFFINHQVLLKAGIVSEGVSKGKEHKGSTAIIKGENGRVHP